MTESPVTVAIVEDDGALRESLIDIIETSPRWKLAAAFPDGESALKVLANTPPHVVLMDIQLPGMSGIECVEKLSACQPDTEIVMLTVYDNNEWIYNALAAGAAGYLLKRDIADRLLESLDEVLAGGSPMSGAIARKVVRHFKKKSPTKSLDLELTPRETQILNLLVKGSLYKEIAWDLGIGVETVRTHLHKIYGKLHVRTRTEAVVKYLGRD